MPSPVKKSLAILALLPAGALILLPATASAQQSNAALSNEAAQIIAHARGCWGYEIDINNPDEYAQFKTTMQDRVQAGESVDCAEAGAVAVDQPATSSGGSAWGVSGGTSFDDDQTAAQVSRFAQRCWGLSGISQDSPSYTLMKRRMAGNDCPNAGANQASSGVTWDNAFDADSGASTGGGYQSAVSTLEQTDAERRQLEAAEQAWLAEQQRLEEEANALLAGAASAGRGATPQGRGGTPTADSRGRSGIQRANIQGRGRPDQGIPAKQRLISAAPLENRMDDNPVDGRTQMNKQTSEVQSCFYQ